MIPRVTAASRLVAGRRRAAADLAKPRRVTRVSVLRAAFSLLGVGIALAAVATMEAESAALYVAFFALIFALEFIWLGSRFPFALPYYTALNAFAYIAGPAVTTLAYAARAVAYPIIAWFARRGWMSLPPPLEGILGHNRGGFSDWIDHGTACTLAALGVVLRAGLFTWLQWGFELGTVPAIAISEYAALAILGIIHAVVPLPIKEDMRLGGRWRWRLDDERIDLVIVVLFVSPVFVFVINLAWAFEGLAGAVGFTLATLGPHLLMKLSNDRLSRVSGLLESKERELKDLVHTVAHDLKSPINSALLTADLVLDREGSSLNQETRADLNRVIRLLGRTEDMVRDLMRVFRIVWEPERKAEVDLNQTLAKILETVDPKATARGASVTVAPLPRLWGQGSKLEHVFSNLLENAVKHVPEGTGAIRVEAEVAAGASDVTICIADNGCGIPREYRNRIFDLYARVPAAGEQQSSGVGLAIVKRIVDAHRGRVWVESEPGAGSRFYVRLPGVIASAHGNDAPLS